MKLVSAPPQLSGREIMRILAGLMLALFSSVLSTMIVTNALPTIVTSLGGGQAQYTWLVTASLLMMTATMPVWGKCADQFSKKRLVQLALLVFVSGSIGAGLSQSMGMLIGMRALQGVAMGGLLATTQAVIGSIVPPRQGGRYASYIGAVMAAATLCGPLVGGVIVDTEWLGWRWCFFVVVPLATVSLLVLQRHLHVPTTARKVRVDYAGSVLVAVTASLPLVWVTFAGDTYEWVSWQSAAFLTGTLLAGALTVRAERRHPEPIISPSILRNRTTALAIAGSVGVGAVMFSSMVFLSQYFQVVRGYSPTEAGLLGMPMMIGTAVGTLGSGHLISRFGRWKRFLVGGSCALTAGLALLGLLDAGAPAWQVLAPTVLVGLGIGTLLQNYVLAVQNTVDVGQVGAAGASVSFFRSLGGVVGVSMLGAIVTHQVSDRASGGASSGGAGSTLDLSAMSPAAREAARSAYADAIGTVFLVSACLALVSLLAASVIRETALRTTIGEAGEDQAGGER